MATRIDDEELIELHSVAKQLASYDEQKRQRFLVYLCDRFDFQPDVQTYAATDTPKGNAA